jgi:hypothetical protein
MTEHLERAESNLLTCNSSKLIQALMGAEADADCGAPVRHP